MPFTKTQILLMGVGLVFVIAIALLFLGIIPGLRSTGEQPLAGTLTVWGVYDSKINFDDAFTTPFKTLHPQVEIQYREMNPVTYEQDLVNALAAGTGPDVFMIKNTWLPKHANKILSYSPDQFPIAQYEGLFPTVAVRDFTINGATYALPLYTDTLALFYNKELLDQAGIAQVPKTWDELSQAIPKLRRVDAVGLMTEPAVALGSARNVTNAPDLMSLMFLQNGVEMTSLDRTEAKFANNAGEQALQFYTSFANSGNSNYAWNRNLPNSLDAFANETLPMMFGYEYQLAEIRDRNPFLNFGIAPMLQKTANDRVNYASYWGLAVAKQARDPQLATTFMFTAATDPVMTPAYLAATGHPPALRSLIGAAPARPDLAVFNAQTLTAQSWYQADAPAIDQILIGMIESVIAGQANVSRALESAENAINGLFARSFSQ